VFAVLGDERGVPEDSPESNYGNLRPALEAWGLPDARIVRPRPALGAPAAAERFDADLRAFLGRGGRLELGFLGLGADGHTASLFTADDVARGAGRLALAVPRPSGPARVSVTRDLLARVARLLVLVADSPDKRAAVATLLERPDSVAAGLALHGRADVQVWAGWVDDLP
jgi:6-phosphogluconolactonase